ncbi:MAG: hypothetical protein HN413_17470 [Chloroflexi bacterium]|nr:hypothetical protein [Chloroflexota bacterium]
MTRQHHRRGQSKQGNITRRHKSEIAKTSQQ